MPNYSYVAKDANGKNVKGTIEAEDEKDFLDKIHQKGLYCTDYNETAAKAKKSVKKFKTKDLAFNCRQLSAMLTSGLTLVKALDILAREQPSEAAKAVWQDIYENVQKGESFSAALEMHSGTFPQFLISMVNAGESSGSLDVIMQRMSDHYAKENKMNNTVKSAMMYPMILLILSIVIVIGMFTFIMPTFVDMFEDPSTMPTLTKAMLAISDFMKKRWYILIGIVVVLVFVIRYLLKIPSFRLKFDKMLIKGPGFGKLIVTIYTARFARTMSSLYSSGIPMVECLERASSILGNSYIDEKFEKVIDEVKQGAALSSAIQRTEIFDSMFCSIIYVGEESGALDDILTKTSDYYEEESDSAVQRLVAMLEPLMIIVLGIMVGLIVASVLPALYSSFDNIQ
ncbi:MAG: type II secretion system F family protein [Oscillospiraceae bacterium]|nr:type II secretion system F family protein [Oscillospiraceae bacterium]